MWQRWNQSTHVFEKSTDNGATWTLMPIAASNIEGGGNFAYTDVSNVFEANQKLSTNDPTLIFEDTSEGTDLKFFDIVNSGQLLHFRAVNDAYSSAVTPLQLNRAGDIAVGRHVVVDHAYSQVKLRHSGTAYGRLTALFGGTGEIRLTQNGMFDGTQWDRDDTTYPMGEFELQQGGFHFYYAPAGANPATLTRLIGVTPTEIVMASQSPILHQGMIRVEGSGATIPGSSSGLGIELFAQSGNTYVHAYNRSTAAYGPIVLYGSSVSVGNSNLNVSGNIHIVAGYLYPGQIDAGGGYQGSWYLASHSSYGLYTNTGIYCTGLWSTTHLWGDLLYIGNSRFHSASTGKYQGNNDNTNFPGSTADNSANTGWLEIKNQSGTSVYVPYWV